MIVPAATTIATVTAVTPIIPPTTIRATAPIRPIAPARSAAILIAEQAINPIASGNLIVNRLCRNTALTEFLSMPFHFSRKIRQLRRTKALAHALRHNRRAVFRRDMRLLHHSQTLGAARQHIFAQFLPLVLSASRQFSHFISCGATTECFGQRFQCPLATPLPMICYSLRPRLLQ
jgi:hypothetical protein